RADQKLAGIFQRIEDRVSRLPGVASEGVSVFSFGTGQRTVGFTAPGVNLPDATRLSSENFVSPGYFSTLHIPLLAGRLLNASDAGAAPMAAVVSESFAA